MICFRYPGMAIDFSSIVRKYFLRFLGRDTVVDGFLDLK